MLNCRENNCFFVTNKKCKAISLNNDLTQLEKGRSFLIFNSNLFYDDQENYCYYYDKQMNNFFMTVSQYLIVPSYSHK